ncbi:MAG: hypothetical protein RLZZ524_779, partial [Pseudomonadota bacterium]
MTASEAPEPRLPPPPFAPPPPDRWCDLVLTGGVVSGVLYPAAIGELARHYRFHALGGTSVGAIAAAITAAAEYQRRLGSDAGFDVLARLPANLAEPVPSPQGRVREVTRGIEPQPTTLLSLFQPATPAGVRLLRLFLASQPGQPAPRGWQRLRAAMGGLWRAYPLALLAPALVLALVPLLSLVLAGAVGFLAFLAALPLALLVGPLVLVVQLLWDLRSGLLGNHFGLCTGLGQPGAGKGLTDWLHDAIQWAAGRLSHETPMTFRDLAEAPEGEL